MNEKRMALLEEIWREQNTAYDLMLEYDSLPRRFGDNFLFQAETNVIRMIARYPDITITDMANILQKSVSACSQIVRKLCTKNLVEQIRNPENKRLFNLRLTQEGWDACRAHAEFEKKCIERTYQYLSELSEEQLSGALETQKKLNDAYQEDIRQSREFFM